MARGFPSMTALLGLLAVAGFQNRDKIAEMLRGSGVAGPVRQGSGSGAAYGGHDTSLGRPGGSGDVGEPAAVAGGMGGGLGSILGSLGAGGVGGFLANGLGELVERFRQAGHGDTVESWIGKGPNRPLEPQALEQGIGPDVLGVLAQQTGLSREELIARLSRELPDAVDRYTPQGHVPAGDESEGSANPLRPTA